MSTSPLIPDIGVLALVPDRFCEPWMSRHQILTRLARYFHVVWADPAEDCRTIVKSGWGLGARRVRNGITRAQLPGFAVYTPNRWLPMIHRPELLARWSFRTRLSRARAILAARGCKKVVLSLWRPEFEPALASVRHDLAWYHIVDEYSFSEVDVPVDESELRLIVAADVVSVHSPGLLRRKGAINPRTVVAPNGVDYEAYATAAREPTDLAPIARPRIGYAGFLKRQLDWPLLLGLARAHREWSFVFVGARKADTAIERALDELGRQPNVHLLGLKRTEELAKYPQHFDVCLMPYRVNDYTKYIYPLKLHEYLAAGRPTVGARIRTLEDFAEVVSLASTPDEWSAKIEQALTPAARGHARTDARRAVARRHDWNIIVRQIAERMAEGLGLSVFSRSVASSESRHERRRESEQVARGRER
jgi:glycosyltransferase involved in cell wall biosynthesis